MSTWNKDATMAYLNANPLPVTFKWHHRDDPKGSTRPVMPSHKNVTAYGKWLRETPYFPGLFEEIHEALAAAPDLGDAEWLAAELIRREQLRQGEKLPLF
jgi:hypothetical protein